MNLNNKIYKMMSYLDAILLLPVFIILMQISDEVINKLQFQNFSDLGAILVPIGTMLVAGICIFLLAGISVIIHEIGHCVFGVLAGLDFQKFSVGPFLIVRKDGKLKLCVSKQFSDVAGYCELRIDETKQYDMKKIKLYFLGGIIFNFATAFVLFITFLIFNDKYSAWIIIPTLTMNFFFAVHNSIPQVTTTGILSDIVSVYYVNQDNRYLYALAKAQKIQEFEMSGHRISELEIEKPEMIKTNADILFGAFYIDYLLDKGQYEEAQNYCYLIINTVPEKLSKPQISGLKMALVECLLNTEYDHQKMVDLWTKDVLSYVKSLWLINPVYTAYTYIYFTLVNPNKSMAQRCLKMINGATSNKSIEIYLKNAKDMIVKTDEIVKNNKSSW